MNKIPSFWVLSLAVITLWITPTVRSASVTVPHAPNLAHGAVTISDPQKYSDIYAISDVHGMYAHLLTLLTSANLIDSGQNWTGGSSLLVIVGDSIDKGPQSIEVVDLWIKLRAQAQRVGGRVLHLLGNHEAEFLAAPTDDTKAKELLDELAAQGLTADNFIDLSQPHGAFLREEPLAARIGNWLFCHAGLYPSIDWGAFGDQAQLLLSDGNFGDKFLTGDDSVLEAKDWWKEHSARKALLDEIASQGFVGLVQGHQPTAYNISDAIGSIEGGRMIRIDTGMAPDAGSNPGMILHFTSPVELTTQQIPDAEIIKADGSRSPLVAQKYDSSKFTPDLED